MNAKLNNVIQECEAEPYVGKDYMEFEKQRIAGTSKKQHKHKKASKDPLSLFGSGIDIYFRFLREMMVFYVIIIILITPVLMIYNRYGGLNSDTAPILSKLSLGNLGFAKNMCFNQLSELNGLH